MKLVVLLAFLVLILKLDFVEGDVFSNESPLLKISNGPIKGKTANFRGSRVYQFLGIPFAEPPLNKLRFKKPVPKKPWTRVLAVDEWAPHCIQGELPGLNDDAFIDEDCLTLNVFVSAKTLEQIARGKKRHRPVMVWIHAGAFMYGSANVKLYDGSALAVLGDVVFVSINYRLGPLGFLHLPQSGIPGNMGLWDQRLALKWIQENIAHFGGDPGMVTIFGVSAGSMSVSAHILSPHSRGLFRNAIMQSGSVYDMHLWYNPRVTSLLLDQVNCTSSFDILACLRSIKASKLTMDNGFLFWPTVDNDFLPAEPQELIKSIDPRINILLGVQDNEGAGLLVTLDPVTFSPTNPANLTLVQAKIFLATLVGHSALDYFVDRYFTQPHNPQEFRLSLGHVLADTLFTCPTLMFGSDATKIGLTNIYAYVQTQKPKLLNSSSTWIPATHGDDIPMIFGAPLFERANYTHDDVVLSLLMIHTWGQFAHYGKPELLGSREWLRWRSDESGRVKKPIMELNAQRLDHLNHYLIENCERYWPFPINKLNLQLNFDKLRDLQTIHDEL